MSVKMLLVLCTSMLLPGTMFASDIFNKEVEQTKGAGFCRVTGVAGEVLAVGPCAHKEGTWEITDCRTGWLCVENNPEKITPDQAFCPKKRVGSPTNQTDKLLPSCRKST